MKDRKERIYQYLQEVCACNSVSCTHDEYKAGDWFAEFFRKMRKFSRVETHCIRFVLISAFGFECFFVQF